MLIEFLNSYSHSARPIPDLGGQSNSSFPPPPWEAEAAENGQMVGNPHAQPMQNSQLLPGSPHALPMHNNQLMAGSPNALSMQNNQLVAANSQQLAGGSYAHGMYAHQITGGHPAMLNQTMQSNQMVGLSPQPMQGGQLMGMFPQQMPSGQMGYMYPQQIYGNQMAGYGYGYAQPQNTQFLNQRMSGLSVRDDGVLNNSSYPVSTPSYVPSGKPSKPEDKLFGDLVDISKFKSSKTTPGRAGSM